MKFLITVVRQNACANFFGDSEHESVAAAHCPSRWRNQFVVINGAVEFRRFALVDAMAKRGIHYDRYFAARELLHKRQHGFVQLLQTGRGSAFGRNIRPIHHHMLRSCFWHGFSQPAVGPPLGDALPRTLNACLGQYFSILVGSFCRAPSRHSTITRLLKGYLPTSFAR